MATSSITTAGIGSGLDIEGIISKLMAVEQRPLALLNQQEASFQAKLTGYGTLKGALASFQDAMKNLSSTASLQGVTAVSSDTAVLSASAAKSAVPGTYTINIDHLAQSQVLAAAGVLDVNAASSTGTLTVQVGTAAATNITINASNNTLDGLREAINAANAGVTATIVNDGSATPNKLVLTASASGAANTIQITNGLSAGELHDAVASLAEVRNAQDAGLTINGVAISSASNKITSAISGVTINLLKSGDATLTVARDTASLQAVAGSFVKAYNDLNTAISGLMQFDASTKKGAVLLGDSVARNLQTQVRALLGQPVGGATGITVLAQAGISFQKDGTLALDSAKLSAAIESDPTGVAALFGIHAQSSSVLLNFLSSTSATQPGTYQITITTAASRGSATATNAPAASTVIDGTNDGFAVVVDGVASGTVSLAQGTYTATQLAAALQAALNGAPALSQASIAVEVSSSSGKLVITSQKYGIASSVSAATGTALSALGFNGTESGTGTDVAGNFVLNGQSIAATGSGQTLSGAAGSAAEGLRVQYSGTAAQAVASPTSTLLFSEGYASKLHKLATTALETDGTLAGRTDGINSSIKDIDKRRESVKLRLTQVEANYRAQFTALDALIAQLNQVSVFLTQQLATLAATTPTSK